ncbi:MAG: GNAT family N-acetyltransferase [Pyrinomonadaceae bacterium]
MAYQISFEEKASDEDLRILGEGIERNTEELFPGKSRTNVTFLLRDDAGVVAGGVTGNYGSFGWLWIDTLWVTRELRGGGYGTRLMESIEAEASQNGATQAFLNTMSFEAPEFYKKLGYTVFAELKDFPPGHSRLFLRKTL